jgi:predicted DNA-binding transcriptional regulator YafY
MIYDDPLEATIWFSADQARYIQERQWSHEQKITKRKDGSILLQIKTSGWYDVKKWILSFGSEAELLEPEALRREITEEINGAQRLYRCRPTG